MPPIPTITRRIREQVERQPERVILTFRDLEGRRDEALTYAGLWQSACSIAHALADLPRASRALIVLPLGVGLFRSHLASLQAGLIPIIHSHPSVKQEQGVYTENLRHVLRLLKPEAVVTTARFLPAFAEAGAAGQCRVVLVEAIGEDPRRHLSTWEATHSDDVALIQHSSGSTGLQKGVALTHAMAVEQCIAYARAINADGLRDVICSWLPMYHDMGLFTTWLLPMMGGIPVVAVDPFAWVRQPMSLLDLITEFRGTLCWQPNFAYNLLASRARDEDLMRVDLGSMRGFTNCSEPARASSHRMFLERFAGCGLRGDALWVCYAMAENAFAVTAAGSTRVPVTVARCRSSEFALGKVVAADEADLAATEVVSVGDAIEGTRFKIVDKSRQPLPERRVGEVAIHSPYMLSEYYRDPAATASGIDAESWYYTGDLGFVDCGQLYITGRKKDLLIVGGRNFYPQDVEVIADGCPHAVPGRSVSIGIQDETTGTERIVVLVETRETADDKRTELEASVRRRVFEQLDCPISEVHAVPHMWLLKTSSGKIARRPNLERYRKESGAPLPVSSGSVERHAGVAEFFVWTFVLAAAAYLTVVLQPSLSWGIYAGF